MYVFTLLFWLLRILFLVWLIISSCAFAFGMVIGIGNTLAHLESVKSQNDTILQTIWNIIKGALVGGTIVVLAGHAFIGLIIYAMIKQRLEQK